MQKLRYARMAEHLGISERLLKKWVHLRLVPFIKIGRCVLFDPAKVEAALHRFERKVAARQEITPEPI